MKFEIKEKIEGIEKVALLFLKQCDITGDVDLRADSQDGSVKGELIMSFRNGTFENFGIEDEEAEALGIDRDENEYIKEEE